MRTLVSLALIVCCSSFAIAKEEKLTPATAPAPPSSSNDGKIAKGAKTTKVRNDYGWKNNDGQAINKRHGLILHLGPGGVQRGHPNPIGLPPSVVDFEFTYLHPAGFEANAGLVPGLTGGVRYRGGSLFYGSAGGGIIISGQGIGPGVYTALGVSMMRHWPVTLEAEVKQAVGIAFGSSTRLTMPYAFRMGAGYYF